MLSLFVFINNFKIDYKYYIYIYIYRERERERSYIYSFLTLCLQYLVYMKFSVAGKLPTYKTLLNNLNCPLTSNLNCLHSRKENIFYHLHNMPTSQHWCKESWLWASLSSSKYSTLDPSSWPLPATVPVLHSFQWSCSVSMYVYNTYVCTYMFFVSVHVCVCVLRLYTSMQCAHTHHALYMSAAIILIFFIIVLRTCQTN